MTVVRADRLQREPVEWLWEERIPRGMISIVAGPPGVGKSLFGYALAASASQSGGVIYSTYEESLRKTALGRMEAAGARLDRIYFWTPELPADLDRLEDEIHQRQAELVVLDPVAAHLSVSIYNDQDVRKALTPLKLLAEATNVAVVLVSHTIKRPAASSHPMDSIGGSGGGLTAASRVAYLFGRNPRDADERLLACVKTNIGPEPATFAFAIDVHEFDDVGEVARLVALGERGSSYADARLMIDTTAGKKKPDEKRSAATDFIVRYLRQGPRPASELKEDAIQYGHSWGTIRRASDDLGVVKPRGGPNATWALPPELLAELDASDNQTTSKGDGDE